MYHDLWVVGDEFIKDAGPSLKTLGRLTLEKKPANKTQQQQSRPIKLFMYNNFNVSTHYSSTTTRGLNRILYPFCVALNDRHHLPRYILIIPDKDMITKLTEYKFDNSLTMGSAFNKLINKINQWIQRRRQDLADKRPGALAPENYPTLIWVRMLKRPFIEGEEASRVFSLRNKFNAAMENQILLSNDNNHRIMSIDIKKEEFDRQGNLTSIGKTSFWREVDRAVHKFDWGDIKLLPRKNNNNDDGKPKPSQNHKETRRPLTQFIKRIRNDYERNARDKGNHPPARKRLWSPVKNRSPRHRSSSSHKHASPNKLSRR